MSAFPPPHEANIAHSQLLIIGKVMVTLLGGGLGESLMGAMTSSVTCRITLYIYNIAKAT